MVIFKDVIDDLASNGINALDCVGNCNIRYEKENKVLLHLINKGEKNTLIADKPYPAFQSAGLKVILYLLQDITNVDKSYREIQSATGISLGAIKNTNALLNLWVENYNQVLNPRLLLDEDFGK
jgi:hypothetical protein